MKMRMTSKYNKLRCNTKDVFLKTILSHICIREKDHQMCLKRHTHQIFMSSSHVCFVVEFSILFFDDNNISKSFHKLQGYFKFI
jgi:hypothetical protein